MIALSRDLLWYFNHSLMSTPGKPAIVFHVKALNDARGPKETRVALLRLAGACLAWCLELSLGSQVEETRLDVLTAPQSSETEDEAA